jgi:hypothetical protein
MEPEDQSVQGEPDFSLMLGGPLYQLYLRTRLARPVLELVVRRMVDISLICWVPLLLLAAAGGHLTGGVPVPFLRDVEVHVRFLLALPLLIAAEVLVQTRIRKIVPQFLSRSLIAPQDQGRFEGLIASAMRWRNSVAAEVILLVLVVTVGHWVWRQNLTLPVSTWYAVDQGAGTHLTAAGWYYAHVSLSIFRFMLLRWYFRIFIWYRFLWQVSGMPLQFNFYHADRVGGLGFLTESALAFAPVITSQTMVVSGFIFDRIFYAGEKLPGFRMEIIALLLFGLFVLIFPLGFFAVRLEHAGRVAKRELGIVASHYVNDFRGKWVEGGIRDVHDGESLLGTPDIQSLADMANSFAVVSEMRLVPVTKQTLLRLVILIGFPLLPLTLTVVPLEEIIRRLFKLVF